MNGVIKKKMGEGKTYGFITPEGGDKDIFFHGNSLVGVTFDELKDGVDGTAVTFDVEDSPKGDGRKNATNVKLA